MAESDNTGLATLIKQRNSRPAFARVVSWEIEKCSGDPPPRKSKKEISRQRARNQAMEDQKSQQTESGDESGQDSLSEASEYFSADENPPQEVSSSSAGQAAGEGGTGTGDEVEVTSAFFNDVMNFYESADPRRGLSKKQKRKRRRQREDNRVCYADYKAPFRDEGNVNISVDVLREHLISAIHNRPALVPSLFQLCTASLSSSSGNNLKGQTAQGLYLLPNSLTKSIFTCRQSQTFYSLQLSLLYRTMAEVEGKYHLWNSAYTCMDDLITRNVWSLEYTVLYHNTSQLDSSVIPFTYANCSDELETSFYKHDIWVPVTGNSLMTSVLDLMVPVHLRPTRRKQKDATTMDREDQALSACVKMVLENLKKRYPNMVEYFGNRALPYLFWLRGHNKLALKQFLSMSDAAKTDKYKVHYLLEAARLCQLLGNTESAHWLFRQSHDFLLDLEVVDEDDVDRIKHELEEQKLTLCANTHDQGVLSQEKAVRSLQAWERLSTIPCAHADPNLSVAQYLLCYHLSHLPGGTVGDRLRCVLEPLQARKRRGWLSAWDLCMLHAWLGDQEESAKACHQSLWTTFYPDLELYQGEIVKPAFKSSFTPWQVLIDAAEALKHPVNPLVVVWRTQPGFFRVVKSLKTFVGDLQGESLSLGLSSDGHLTGDLHLDLPPVRAFNLDLYTGKLVMPPTPGLTYAQKDLFNSRRNPENTWGTTSTGRSVGPYALTPIELYRDAAGRTLHCETTGHCDHLSVSFHVCTLRLTEPDCQHTKVHLAQLFRRAQKESLLEVLHEKYPAADDANLIHGLRGVEYMTLHAISLSNVFEACELGEALLNLETLREKEKQKKKCARDGLDRSSESKAADERQRAADEKIKQRLKQKFLGLTKPLKISLLDFVSYGQTVCVLADYGMGQTFHMFLDVSSRETFLSPMMHTFRDDHKKGNKIPTLEVMGRLGNVVPRAEVMCLIAERGTHVDIFRCFDGKGKLVRVPGVDPAQKFNDSQCLLGRSVYVIENLRKSGQAPSPVDLPPTLSELRFNMEGEESDVYVYDADPKLLEVKVVGDRLLLVRQDGLRVLRPDGMLPEPLGCCPGSECHVTLSDDGVTLLMAVDRVSVLAERAVTSPSGRHTVLVPVACNNRLLVLALTDSSLSADFLVEIAFCVQLPGHATEAVFISHAAGYLVNTTFHGRGSRVYVRESVCHLGPGGQLLALLPCLGPGPREFCPVLLPPPPSAQQGDQGSNPGTAVWHVYMRDGHEGIVSVRL